MTMADDEPAEARRPGIVLQLHYTSCRRGLSGHPGFQTRAASRGLTTGERRQIEAKALYSPPRDAPRDPDAGQLADFPVAFRTVELSSGRIAVLRAVYNGADYSGRPGNYFVHALVLDGGVAAFWPIDLYGWKGWVGRLAAGDDDGEPEPLPSLPIEALGDVAPEPDFSFAGIGAFLGGEAGRQETLGRMLRAVFRRAEDSRSLVIRERSGAAAAAWIAGVQKAFPAGCRREVACSTFQSEPRSVLPVNGTTGRTEFLFDETERKYQFYLFDFVSGEHSDVPEDGGAGGEYAGRVAEWMATRPDRMEGFHAFAGLFDAVAVGPELVHILRLYRLEVDGGAGLATRELLAALEFAGGHIAAGELGRVLAAAGTVDLVPESGRVEDWGRLIHFLVEGAARTGEDAHMRSAWSAWGRAFEFLVLEERAEDGEGARSLLRGTRTEMERRFRSVGFDSTGELLSESRLAGWWRRVPGVSGETLQFLMTELCDVCRETGAGRVSERLEVRRLVRAVVEGRGKGEWGPDLVWVLRVFRTAGGGPQIDELGFLLSSVVRVLARRGGEGGGAALEQECGALGRSFFEAFGAAGDRREVFEEFAREPGFAEEPGRQCLAEVVLGGWLAALDAATDKAGRLEEYREWARADHLFEAPWVRMAEMVFDLRLSGEERERLARSWVESRDVERFSDDFAGTVLTQASRAVTFAPEDRRSGELAGAIRGLDRRKALLPRLGLRVAACALMDGTPTAVRWTGVDEPTYAEFIGALKLPAPLSRAKTPEEYGTTLGFMVNEEYVEVFAAAYLKCLGGAAGRDGRRRPGLVARLARGAGGADAVDPVALEFWLRKASRGPVLDGLRPRALDTLAERIAGVRGRKARLRAGAALDGVLEREGLDPAAVESFRDRVRPRPGLMRRLLRR